MPFSRILLIGFIVLLPLVHAKLLPTLGIPYSLTVYGNFEFTRVIFFQVVTTVIFFVFLLEFFFQKQNRVFLGATTWIAITCILLYVSLSTFFSISPFISLIGDTQKGHTQTMIFALIALGILVSLMTTEGQNTLKRAYILSGVIVCLIAVKEYFFPTFGYGALGSRALGTFGHPNYLAAYILILLPFTQNLLKPVLRWSIFGLFAFTLILTQSALAIACLAGYIALLARIPLQNIFSSLFPEKLFTWLSYLVIIGAGLCGFWYVMNHYPEKMHSFISRWYIWETTFHMITSSTKSTIIGSGTETLPYYFNSFKVPEMYVFEKFGFTADRPHNLFLNIWYHFGLIGFVGSIALIWAVLKKWSTKGSAELMSLYLFIIFAIFQYFSIASLVLVTVIIASIYASQAKSALPNTSIVGYIGVSLILFFGAIASIKLYQSEILYANGKVAQAQENFPHPKYLITLKEYEAASRLEGITSEKNYREQILHLPQKESLCEAMLQDFPSAENYMYCGDIFEKLGKDNLAKTYYTGGLQKLPDLWNANSPYWDNYFVAKTVNGNKFFSEKFGNLSHILEYLAIPITYNLEKKPGMNF